MAARLERGRRAAMVGRRRGLDRAQRGLHTLEHLWPKIAPRPACCRSTGRSSSSAFRRAASRPGWRRSPARPAPPCRRQDARPALLEELKNVTPAERLDLALTHMRKQAARVLAIDDGESARSAADVERIGVRFAHGGRVCQPRGPIDRPASEPGAVVRLSHPGEPRRLRGPRRSATGIRSGGRRRGSARRRQTKAAQQVLAEVESMSEEDMDALVSQQLEQLSVESRECHMDQLARTLEKHDAAATRRVRAEGNAGPARSARAEAQRADRDRGHGLPFSGRGRAIRLPIGGCFAEAWMRSARFRRTAGTPTPSTIPIRRRPAR